MSERARYGFDITAAIPKDIQPADLIVNGVEYLPVVRCKYCDYWNEDENILGGICDEWSDFEDGIINYTKPDDYCSRGERKEEENK